MNWRIKDWLTRRALRLIVWLHRDSNYIAHVHREVPGWFEEEGPNRWIADGTIELLSVLSHQGHYGWSIGFAVNFLRSMALFEPWGPLTGEESEWGEPFDPEGARQNRRCSHVFKNANGTAYDIDGKIFREPDGNCYTSWESRVAVEFPYTPKRVYVEVPHD